MQSKVDLAVQKFKEGYNCAQAVICTYAPDFDIEEEQAFRLAEGFGSGIPGLQSLCGAASGMIMCASLQACPKMDVQQPTKGQTYALVKHVNELFINKMGAIDCRTLLQSKDQSIIDGKRAGCIECVKCACEIIEDQLYER